MQRDEELINLVVDGEASSEEKRELQEMILRSRETREAFEATRSLVARLEAMPVLELPAAPFVPVARVDARRVTRRRVFTAVWAAAAAIILAVFLIQNNRDMPDTSATMAPPSNVVVLKKGTEFLLEPVLPSARPLTVTMRWDPQVVEPVAISGGSDASLGHTTAKFTLRTPSERAGVLVRARGNASVAEIWVSAGGQVSRSVVRFH